MKLQKLKTISFKKKNKRNYNFTINTDCTSTSMQIRYANNSMEIAKNYRDVTKKKKKENSMKRGVLSVHQKRDEKEAIVMCNFDVAALCRVGA